MPPETAEGRRNQIKHIAKKETGNVGLGFNIKRLQLSVFQEHYF